MNKVFINSLLNHLFSLYDKICCRLISTVESLYFLMIGVEYGGNGKFHGWCSVYKRPYSSIKIGKNCIFNSSHYSNHIGLNHRCIITTMTKDAEVVIGDNVGVSSSSITSFKSVSIGNNVRIGANCVIMDGDFHLDDPRTSPPAPITIKDNVWLGYGVIVMKGVTIGENSVIGVNSIVTKNIPANIVAAGNPCKIIRSLEQV